MKVHPRIKRLADLQHCVDCETAASKQQPEPAQPPIDPLAVLRRRVDDCAARLADAERDLRDYLLSNPEAEEKPEAKPESVYLTRGLISFGDDNQGDWRPSEGHPRGNFRPLPPPARRL